MRLTAELQNKIDSMTYVEMLSHTRFDPVGCEWWVGEVGDAMVKRLNELTRITPADQRIAASKDLGW